MRFFFIFIFLILLPLPSLGKHEVGRNKEKERNFLKDTATINYFLWGGRILYVRNKDSKIFDTSLKKWGKNIISPELNDGDNFATNYVYHPYFGALYYQVYRDLGYSKEDSYIGSIIQSSLWEFTIEGTVEKPSIVDLIVTPGLGIPLGIYFEKINDNLYNSDSSFAKALSYIINPTRLFMNEESLGFINPLSGSFMVYKPLNYRDTNYQSGYFLISGISVDSYIFDIKQYRGGGTDIMYTVKADFVNNSKDLLISIKFPWAGAYDGNDQDYNVVDNGFEVGNFQLGITKILNNNDNFYYGSSIHTNFSTSSIWGDKKERLQKLHSNSLILKDVLHDSSTITPNFFIGNKFIKAGLSTEVFLNANDYSSESEEIFIVYDISTNIFESKNKKYNFNLDLKFIDKTTEENSGLDSIGILGFTLVENLDLSVKYIHPFNGDISKYLHNGLVVSLKVPLI